VIRVIPPDLGKAPGRLVNPLFAAMAGAVGLLLAVSWLLMALVH